MSHHLANQSNHALIKRENDSDENDVVYLTTVPTGERPPEDYDPQRSCRMCKIVKKLLPECTCKDCRAVELQHSLDPVEGQMAVHSTDNVTHDVEVSAIPKREFSSIHYDASTNGLVSENHQHVHSRISTPDYLPRFLDDGNKVGKKLVQGSARLDGDNRVPDYVLSNIHRESTKRSNPSSSATSSKHLTETIDSTVKRFVCPTCKQNFTHKASVYCHYYAVHQQLKPYYCKWAKCDFAAGRRDYLVHHITMKHFNRINNNKGVQTFIGKRETVPKDHILVESIDIPKNSTLKGSRANKRIECQKCGRDIVASHFNAHICDAHEKTYYLRCIWSKCGLFFSSLAWAQKHVCTDHLQCTGETLYNFQLINQYLVNVNPNK